MAYLAILLVHDYCVLNLCCVSVLWCYVLGVSSLLNCILHSSDSFFGSVKVLLCLVAVFSYYVLITFGIILSFLMNTSMGV